jgi:peroxiredoxin
VSGTFSVAAGTFSVAEKVPDTFLNEAERLRTPLAFVRILSLVALTWLLPFAVGAAEQNLLKKFNFIPETGFVRAPDFATVDAEGNEVRLDSYAGKVVILNFWATWCPPCRLEMPSMEKLYREFKDQGLEIVAVNFMESLEPVQEFIKEQGFTYPILMDKKARIAELYGVMRLPETVLIGRKGNLLGKSTGYKDWYKESAREFVALLLTDEEAVRRGASASSPGAASSATTRNPFLMLAFGLALVMFLAYYVKKANTKRTVPDE